MELIANDFKDERLMVLTVHPGRVYTDTSKRAPEMSHPCELSTPPTVILQPINQNTKAPTDDPCLCGGFLVWLTQHHSSIRWLNGRFLSATWDVDELLSMKDAIVKSDMLKARMVVT